MPARPDQTARHFDAALVPHRAAHSLLIARFTPGYDWQEWRDSNPQPPVLETGALPIELHSYGEAFVPFLRSNYSTIDATTPAPTVRPPSRMANLSPSSIAIGAISSTSIDTLSPGITISVPSGSSTWPVTSVVRK